MIPAIPRSLHLPRLASTMRRATLSVHRQALLPCGLARWQPPPANYDTQFGDYPKLPWSAFGERDAFAKWDDPVHRRNFGETIHEEFDVQDAFFQGEHTPAANVWKGVQGQVFLLGLLGAFLLAAKLTDHEATKPPARILPVEVSEYMATGGMDKVKRRPYDAPKHMPFGTLVHPDVKLDGAAGDGHHH